MKKYTNVTIECEEANDLLVTMHGNYKTVSLHTGNPDGGGLNINVNHIPQIIDALAALLSWLPDEDQKEKVDYLIAKIASSDKGPTPEPVNFIDAARDAAILWARELLASVGWVILDTETTGLDYRAEIVQIAVIDPHSGKTLNTMVKPRNPIPPEATRIHGITNEMVANFHTFADVWFELGQMVNDKAVVIYNADFDRRLIGQSIANADVPALDCKFIDAMQPYAEYVGEWDEFKESFRWQKLPGGDHSALGDCKAVLSLIEKMAASSLTSEGK